MTPWFWILLAACAVVLTGALLVVLISLKRTLDGATAVLRAVEEELRPTTAEARALTQELRAMSRQLQGEIAGVGEVVDRVSSVVDSLARVMSGLAGLTRTGQIIGIAAGFKKGVDVFVQRWRAHDVRADAHAGVSSDGHSRASRSGAAPAATGGFERR